MKEKEQRQRRQRRQSQRVSVCARSSAAPPCPSEARGARAGGRVHSGASASLPPGGSASCCCAARPRDPRLSSGGRGHDVTSLAPIRAWETRGTARATVCGVQTTEPDQNHETGSEPWKLISTKEPVQNQGTGSEPWKRIRTMETDQHNRTGSEPGNRIRTTEPNQHSLFPRSYIHIVHIFI